ncbi:MAG: 3-dehydroquinate synthase [Oscillospiraceae bacterium]
MKKTTVKLKNSSYDIIIGKQILDYTGKYIKQYLNFEKVFILSEENVWKIYGQQLQSSLKNENVEYISLILKPGEENKSFLIFQQVIEYMATSKITRNDLFICFGGGVIGDLGGFCASVYMRGINYIQIPTTLLSQVDSSIGGKTAININSGKNLVGSFYQPKLVITDTSLLSTLPKRELSSGVAEVIKYAVLYSERLFKTLLQINSCELLSVKCEDIIFDCCNFKKEVVEIDEFDNGERAFLNLGHTFGHAIEKSFNYQKYNHGEAVSIGIFLASLYSEIKNPNSKPTSRKIYTILKKYNLPVDDEINLLQLCDYFSSDKKSTGEKINLILINDISDCYISSENLECFKNSMADLQVYRNQKLVEYNGD